MIKVLKRNRVSRFLNRYGLEVGAASLLLFFGLTTGWWAAAFLSAYFFFTWVLYLQGKISASGAILLAMLPIIKDKIDRLERWQREAEERTLDAVVEIEPDVVELNYEAQLYDKGILATGKPVKPKYTPYTVKLKGFKGQPTDRVTLRDTGDFHASFALEREKGELVFYSGDWKEPRLRKKYGDDIFGLTPGNLQKVISWIREPVLRTFKKMIG